MILTTSKEIENQEIQIKGLLSSGQIENIELAYMLMKSLNLNQELIVKPFRETFDFLKGYGIISKHIPFCKNTLGIVIDFRGLSLYKHQLDDTLFMNSLKNLPNLTEINIADPLNLEIEDIDKLQEILPKIHLKL